MVHMKIICFVLGAVGRLVPTAGSYRNPKGFRAKCLGIRVQDWFWV